MPLKFGIYKDEAYPVYCLIEEKEGAFEIPQDKLDWIEKTEAEYDKTQEYLAQLKDDSEKKRRRR